MSRSGFSISALAAACLSLSSAHAGLIFGWSAFDARTGDFLLPPDVIPNFEGTGGLLDGYISLLSETSTVDTGGTSDGSWGNLADAGNPPGTNNGYSQIRAGNRYNMYFSNPGAVPLSITLTDVWFDYAKVQSGAGTLSLWWEPDPTLLFAVTRTDTNASYFDADVPTSPPADQTFFLAPGEQKLVLSFRAADRTFRLDNIRVDGDVAQFSAIPEVSSSLIFGGLLGAGLMIRRRPRATAARA